MRGWLGVQSAASYCDVSPRTVRSLLKNGLKHVRVQGNGKILIKVEWLDKFLEHFAVDERRVDQVVDEVLKEMKEGV